MHSKTSKKASTKDIRRVRKAVNMAVYKIRKKIIKNFSKLLVERNAHNISFYNESKKCA